MNLDGRVALITGAKGGLGTYVTNAFLSAGATVAGVSRSIRDADFPHEQFAGIAAELSTPEQASGAVAKVVQRFGSIDILVHLLGAYAGGSPIHESPATELDRMLDLNFRSAFFVLQAAVPLLRQSGAGRVLAVGSKAGLHPQSLSGAYNASKAALASLIQTAALENRDARLTANIVLPGTMDTAANRAANPNVDPATWVQPCQVANLLVYLASDLARDVNGAMIPVSGRE